MASALVIPMALSGVPEASIPAVTTAPSACHAPYQTPNGAAAGTSRTAEKSAKMDVLFDQGPTVTDAVESAPKPKTAVAISSVIDGTSDAAGTLILTMDTGPTVPCQFGCIVALSWGSQASAETSVSTSAGTTPAAGKEQERRASGIVGSNVGSQYQPVPATIVREAAALKAWQDDTGTWTITTSGFIALLISDTTAALASLPVTTRSGLPKIVHGIGVDSRSKEGVVAPLAAAVGNAGMGLGTANVGAVVHSDVVQPLSNWEYVGPVLATHPAT